MDLLKPFRRGRRSHEPSRETEIYPRMVQLGQQPRQRTNQLSYKPTPRNLRYFATTPYARRCINAYKNTITQLDWEIVVKPGAVVSDELHRQMEVVQNCFEHPNDDDSLSQLLEQVVEDMMLGAGAIEQEIGGNPMRPLWMWPVDGLSIQIYPLWDGSPTEARYAQMLGYGQASGSQMVAQLRNEQLIYIRPNPNTANPFGLGPIEVAFQSIARLLGVGDYAGKLSSNTSPAGMLHLGNVDDSHVKAFRQYWKNDIEGQGKMPISGGGDKPPTYLDLHPQGDTALYLKYQDFLKKEIATACDLSSQNVAVDHDLNRNTSETSEDRDMQQAIGPFARKLQNALTYEAIQRRLGFYSLEFRFKGLDSENEKEQAEVFNLEYKNNAETPNGYRARRGLPRLESPWADMVYADVEISKEAAKGAQMISDKEEGFDGQTKAPTPQKTLDRQLQKKNSGSSDRIDTALPQRPQGGRNVTRMPQKSS
jgi:hypothetical protein